jgi:hypothetical protein
MTSFIFSQEVRVRKNYININSLSFRVDSLKELETIKWKDAKEAFQQNDPESEISLEINIENKRGINKKKLKYAFSYKVEGKAKEIDSLVSKMREALKLMKRLTKNLKNED